MPEVAGGPAGRVELDDLPSQVGRLAGHGGEEGVDGGGVLDVPEKLPTPGAGDVGPDDAVAGEPGGCAPTPFRLGQGGAVPAGQEGQGAVGEGQPSHRIG